jgi:1,4-dihydroxy-6-naphthoate synthase
VLYESIKFGLDHRADALDYAGGFGRGLNDDLTDRFVGMYVNDRTLDYGDEGRAAVAELLDRAAAAKLIPAAVPVDWVP